ncbi:hypothetical protein F2Q68_00004770 [Brassica cretica]|uniref:Uncharacterized protein n=1 Tax=Brassica cretica TaxID=69181 RepID=A0A8S9JI93_BRACR|nr:hypothetical protein F2Q68_00004770 [Brassica cretica]
MFVKISSHDVIRFGLNKPDLLSSENNKTWHLLRSFRNICGVLNCDDIVVHNTFFEKRLELLINVSLSELTLLCSDVEKDMHVLRMIDIVACLDTILERQVQSQRYESIALVHQPEIWSFMNLRNGAVHGYSRDDPMSSQQLDDWFRFFSTLQAVEESYKESTYTIPFLRSEAVSQNPTTCPSQNRSPGIKDQFQMEASRGGGHNTYFLGTWNWKYLRKTSSKLQGIKRLFLVGPVRHIRKQIEFCFLVGPVSHIRRQSSTLVVSLGHPQPFVSPFIPSVLLPYGSSPYLSLPVECLFLRVHQVVKMFGIQRKRSKEKSPRQTVSEFPFKYYSNNFDEVVSVQERLDTRCKDHIKTTRDVADPKRRLLQFDVQEICDNFEKGMMKALEDISKNHKKSTSTRAPVAEPSLLISEKPKGKSETHVEEFKDFSDSLPIFDESDEEPIESLFYCEKICDLPSLESEFMNDNERTIVELTVLQPEHPSSLVLSQQDLGPIFDEEDEPGPVFDEEATSITSIVMESHLCFDPDTIPAPLSPDTIPAPLSPDLQEHCENLDLINSLIDMFVKISSHDVIRFGLNKALITGDLFASSYALNKILIKKLLESKSLGTENDFFLNSDDIVVYNTFFEKRLELLINVSRSELTLLYSDVEKDMHVLRMIDIVACLDTILVYNVYFDVHLGRLKYEQLERQVQSQRNESIALVHQPEIWSFMNLRNGAVSSLEGDWLFSTLQAVEESYKESTYTIPFLRSEAVNQNPTTCPSQKRSWPDFEIDKQILGNYFTCLMFAHVLQDYPKSLDPVFDDLRWKQAEDDDTTLVFLDHGTGNT